MEMQIILITFFAGFGLTADVLTRDHVDIETVNIESNGTEIHKHLHNLLTSLKKNDKEKTKTYRDILHRETGKVKLTFDAMKEDLWSVRQRNKARKSDTFRNTTTPEFQLKIGRDDGASTKGNQSFNKEESKSEPVECYYRALKKNEFGIRAMGVIGMNEITREIVSGGVAQEIDLIFQHIKTILQKYGTSFTKVTHFTFSVDDIAHHPMVEKTLMKYVPPPRPSTSLFVKQNLPKNVHVECEFVAFTTKKLERNMTMPTP